ncbi:MAG: DNA polymerase III subunit delta [Gammaproteobacteria bacterium]
MKVRYEQLQGRLARGLAPIYLLAGDEPLFLMEAADAIRAAAREQGYLEREVLNHEPGFDWGRLAAAGQELSLFASQRIIDLRLPTGKPGREGGEALAAYAERPPEDTILLVQCGKLERASVSSKWVKALDKAGVFLQVWPLDVGQTRQWVAARMRVKGLEPTPEAAALLTERVEGNLLAAAQEIDKLSLLHPAGPLDTEAVLAAVADSARFEVFDLYGAALAGDLRRAVRILEGLRGEDVAPPLVLWSLSEQIRTLAGLAEAQARGEPLQMQRIWPEARRRLLGAALRSRPVGAWLRLLARCAHVDRVIKGRAEGRPWDELLQLVMALSGRPLLDGAASGRAA